MVGEVGPRPSNGLVFGPQEYGDETSRSLQSAGARRPPSLVYDVFGSFQDSESFSQGKWNMKMLGDASTKCDAVRQQLPNLYLFSRNPSLK